MCLRPQKVGRAGFEPATLGSKSSCAGCNWRHHRQTTCKNHRSTLRLAAMKSASRKRACTRRRRRSATPIRGRRRASSSPRRRVNVCDLELLPLRCRLTSYCGNRRLAVERGNRRGKALGEHRGMLGHALEDGGGDSPRRFKLARVCFAALVGTLALLVISPASAARASVDAEAAGWPTDHRLRRQDRSSQRRSPDRRTQESLHTEGAPAHVEGRRARRPARPYRPAAALYLGRRR